MYVDPYGLYKWKSGKVEKGDTLSEITSELNDRYGTEHSYGDIAKMNGISDPNKISVGSTVRIGTIDGGENVWQPPSSGGDVNENYWNGLSTAQQKILHYHRNAYQGNIPGTVGEMVGNEWNNEGVAIAHNLAGASGNVDYRGKWIRLGHQAIYDSEGNLVTSAENQGTYDFVPPSESYLEHDNLDVKPWIKWGNNPQDSTNSSERHNAMKWYYKIYHYFD